MVSHVLVPALGVPFVTCGFASSINSKMRPFDRSYLHTGSMQRPILMRPLWCRAALRQAVHHDV